MSVELQVDVTYKGSSKIAKNFMTHLVILFSFVTEYSILHFHPTYTHVRMC